MTVEQFQSLLMPVIDFMAGKPVDAELEAALNKNFPGDAELFLKIEKACHAAIAAGWMCTQGEDGRRFGRVIPNGPATHNFSVDVVYMKDWKGPHHRHPTGEVCMIMPITPSAKFDGRGRGWCVFPHNSGHRPTTTGGEALILYTLPNGEIEFTKAA
jgi:hypothetical protein